MCKNTSSKKQKFANPTILSFATDQPQVRGVFLSWKKIKNNLSENQKLIDLLIEQKLLKPIPKLENCYLAKTDPKDVARVESKTVICTENERETIPIPKPGVEGKVHFRKLILKLKV